MARCTSMAVTVESTPPDRAQMTRWSGPTRSRSAAVVASMKERMVQTPLRPQMRKRKFFRTICTPGGVLDFGVKLHPVEPPLGVTDRPGGAGVAAADDLEPRGGLLHHVAVAHPHGLGVARPWNRSSRLLMLKGLRPYSRDWAGTTRPPSRWLKSWMP